MSLGESVFTIHKFIIEVKELNKPIYLLPFGDVHRFSSMCSLEAWLEYLDWAKKKKNAYFLGMGDYDDMCSGSERREINNALLHDETRMSIEDIYMSRVNKLVNEIKFMKGRIIGLIEGNHYGNFQTGMTTTQEMCRQLECKYLGWVSFVKLVFKDKRGSSSIDLFVAHGKGASRLVGGSLNTVQQMADIGEADIYLMGHDHQKNEGFRERLRLTEGNGNIHLTKRKILYARTGSFLKGYVPDKPSYVAKSLLPPTDIGVIKIELTPKRRRHLKEDKFYIDIHCSI